jgi:hypothetical protein
VESQVVREGPLINPEAGFMRYLLNCSHTL